MNSKGKQRTSRRIRRLQAIAISLARDWLEENPMADTLPSLYVLDLQQEGLDSAAIEQMLLNERAQKESHIG